MKGRVTFLVHLIMHKRVKNGTGFIKITDHRPIDHFSVTRRPTDHLPTDPQTGCHQLKLKQKLFSFSRHLSFCLDFLIMSQSGLIREIKLISNFMTSQPG